jgi:putative DNA primase/helicase
LLRKWLVQAVAAATTGGQQYRGILTFTGSQNIGKTTWFKNLAPAHLELVLTGHTLDTKSKDSQLLALRHWIVELGEVDATFRKSDVSALKSFIGATSDSIRRPYAAAESNYDRRTVFGASVNDSEFLADKTGNSRFWTIPVTGFQFDHGVDMQQLWAEVFDLVEQGEGWGLSPVELALLNKHNEDFETIDPVSERIASGFAWGTPAGWDWLTATQALIVVGIKDPKKSDANSAGATLRKLNGGQRRKSNGLLLFAVPSSKSEFLG